MFADWHEVTEREEEGEAQCPRHRLKKRYPEEDRKHREKGSTRNRRGKKMESWLKP